jgi:uncharacterized repeat protein (TIGR01451 family)
VDGSSSETANVGQEVTFTVQVGNTGPSAATGTTVSDVLPFGLTYGASSAPAGTTYNPITGVWSIGTLAPGASITLTVTTSVSSAAGSFTDTATATDASSVSSTASVDGNAALTVTESGYAGNSVGAATTNAVAAGGDVTYLITAANSGAVTATGVTVTDDLPASFTLDSVTTSTGTVSVSGGVLTWTVGSLAAGATATLSDTETTNAPSTTQTDTSTVSITSTQTAQFGTSQPNLTSADWSIEVLPAADLAITDTDGRTAVIPGTSDTYTVGLTDNGPSAAVDATVTDTLPPGFTVTGHTQPSGSTFTNLGSGVVEWTGINLADGASDTFTVTGAVDPALGAATAFVDIAQVTLPPGEIDTGATNQAVDGEPATPTADLAIEQTDSGDTTSGTFNATTNDTSGGSATPGGSITYTVVVGNTSAQSTMTGVSLNDVLPAAITSDTWSVTASTGTASATTSSGTGTVNDSLTLGPDSSLTVTIEADIGAGATGAIANTATLTPPAMTVDTSSFTGSTDLVGLIPQSTLTISDSDGLSTVTPGQVDTYTIVVSNSGPSVAGDIVVTDTVATQGFTGVSSPGLPVGVTFDASNDSWNVGELAAGASVTLKLSGTVPTGARGETYVDTAAAGASDAATVTATDTDTLAIVLAPTSLPGATWETPYPATTITAKGGVGPCTFTVTNGTLPAGLSLTAATGVLAGTPTDKAQIGTTVTFTVTATDVNQFTGSRIYSIRIGSPCATGLTPDFLSATARTGDFTGLFCLNAAGTGTYTQYSPTDVVTATGTGTVTVVGSLTRVTAFGTDLAVLGQTAGSSSTYTETAPLRSGGTFTLS